jgi:hypothetical protein
MVVMTMMVVPVRSERGTGYNSKQQCNKDPFLHGTTLAWELRTRVNERRQCTL